MLMKTRSCKVLVPKYSKNKSAEDAFVPPLWEKREEKKKIVFFSIGEMEKICRLLSTRQHPKCACIKRLAGARHLSPAVL